MTWIVALIRLLGLPLVIVLAGLAFYEGVPFLNDIPFIDRVPVVRSLIAGRVATVAADAAADARKGYVLETKAAAALALANEYKRQIDAQQVVIDAYQIQYQNQMAKEDAQKAADEKSIQQRRTRKGPARPGDLLDADDIEWLRQ